MESTSCPTLFV
jgi:hypothetical protein